MPLERDSHPTRSYPAEADFRVEVITDQMTGDIDDDVTVVWFTAVRVPHPETWQQVAEEIAGDNELLSFAVRATWQGRYWESDEQTTVTWTNRKAHRA